MHPDLSSHLHTDECNLLIESLQKCHEENPFLKFFGKCNQQDTLMVKCLRQERLARRRKNFEASLEKKAKFQSNL
ncbi:COX assembly mitochondrial protein 2 homolog [Coccinella septempunctata]|uniref:COX assembly mitochondrial protein 2 homolog n=1 Tax=Coccinella septempunctata TaxID=41139 RepID=UPI001D091C8B|nr:COX assembly mitochondrial protein 2 homolog [Coccinella septempunctata]